MKLQIWSRELTTPTLWPSGALSGCGQHAWPKTKESRDLATPLLETFLRGHVRTVPWNIHVKFEVRSFNRFGLLAFNSKSLGGHVTLATPPFRKKLRPIWAGNTCVKFEDRSFNRFGLAFNAQKFRWSRDPGHAPFSKNFKGSCPEYPRKHAH